MQGSNIWAETIPVSSPSTVSPLRVRALANVPVWTYELDPTTVAHSEIRSFEGSRSLATAHHGWSTDTERERQLAAVEDHYKVLRAGDLRKFLPDDRLTSALMKAAELIPPSFGFTGKPILRGVADGDAQEIVELQIVIPVSHSVEEATAVLETFDATWWMNLPDSVRRIITVDVCFT